MFKKIIIFSQILMLVAVWPASVFAQDVIEDDTLQFSYGNVVEILQDKIVINEYNALTDEEEIITYLIDDASYLENIESLTDLIIGDEIEITYNESNNQRTAISLSKMIYEEDEDDFEEYIDEDTFQQEEEGDSSYETRG